MKKPLVLLLAAFLLIPPPAFALPFDAIFVFGDSLSDVGNDLIASGGQVPGPPTAYFNGRFSNGPVYAEYLAQGLGFSLTPSLAGGNDFAYGGARTDSQSFPLGLNLLQQVDAFKSRFSTADPNALYVVFIGANNIQDAIRAVALGANPAITAASAIANAIGDIGDVLNTLIAAGARQFLIPNVPDVGATPRVRSLGSSGLNAFARSTALGFDAALDTLLNTYTGVNIARLNTFGFLDGILNNPGAFGIVNTTDRCYTGDDLNFSGGGSVCANPDQFFFFDGIHPSARVHSLLGGSALAAAIPEPTTALLIAAGLLVLMTTVGRRVFLNARLQGAHAKSDNLT